MVERRMAATLSRDLIALLDRTNDLTSLRFGFSLPIFPSQTPLSRFDKRAVIRKLREKKREETHFRFIVFYDF